VLPDHVLLEGSPRPAAPLKELDARVRAYRADSIWKRVRDHENRSFRRSQRGQSCATTRYLSEEELGRSFW
jgi:hypothetical protein